MIEKLHGIVLGTVRHTDRNVITTVYTAERGTMSLLINAGGRGKSSARVNACIMPLARVEYECNMGKAKELFRPSGLSLSAPYRTLYFDPVKNAIGIFIAEFLGRLLRQSDTDRLLYTYLHTSLQILDAQRVGLGNFHITFLSMLTTFMGIAPDTRAYTPTSIFDMRAGAYTGMHPGHQDILLPPMAHIPVLLSRLHYSNMHRLRLSREQREAMLTGLLRYWSIHFPSTTNLHSLEVLSEVFR